MSKQKQLTPNKLALRHYVRQWRLDPKAAVLSLILPGVGTTLIFYLPPLIIAKVLSLLGSQNSFAFSDLIPYILAFAAVWAAGELLWRVAIHYLIILTVNSYNRLYADAMGDLLKKDLVFFDNNFAGALTKKVIGYARNFETFTDTFVFSIGSNFIPLLFVSVILWFMSPWLLLGLLFSIVLTAVCVIPLIKRRQKIVDAREKASNIVSGNIADIIGNMAAVRTFAQEDYEAKKNKAHVHEYMERARQSWAYQNLRIDVVTSPLYVGANVLGLTLALWLSQQGSLPVEAIFVAFAYYAGITRTMWEFNSIYRNLEASITEAAQFTALLQEKPKIKDDPKAESFNLKQPAITINKINFKYNDNRGEHLFKDLHLAIEPGEKIGLVGPSGGGKTTIAKLLLRVMDVTDGEITVDGRDIRSIRQKDLRKYISYVPQDPLLFHRSLSENIAYGKLEAGDEEIKQAAKLAYADEFIDKLTDGYETLVGERGVKLSGGQRQRVSIARAILKDAPILVLDEATSALDSESESLIQEALTNLMEGRTTIVIAHRLSTIQKMDRIIVLEEGVITEQGSHAELLKKDGLYAKLWNHQSGGFLEE